jgi:hypothetical protein
MKAYLGEEKPPLDFQGNYLFAENTLLLLSPGCLIIYSAFAFRRPCLQTNYIIPVVCPLGETEKEEARVLELLPGTCFFFGLTLFGL